MKRTGSMRSRVGPAVTTTLRPRSSPAAATRGAAQHRLDDLLRLDHAAGAGLAAGLAAVGRARESSTPRWRSVATFACVAALAHIRRFIAGATTIGTSVARHSVDSRSSARPCASRAMKSAVAGAMTMRCGQRASSMWPIAASAAASHRSVRTGRPESAWNVSGVTNSLRAGGHHDLHFGAAILESTRRVRRSCRRRCRP